MYSPLVISNHESIIILSYSEKNAVLPNRQNKSSTLTAHGISIVDTLKACIIRIGATKMKRALEKYYSMLKCILSSISDIINLIVSLNIVVTETEYGAL